MKNLGEKHLTDDNSFLRQTLKALRIAPRKLEESGKILGKTCGLGPTQRYTIERFKREIAPVELKGSKEITTLRYLERISNGNANLLNTPEPLNSEK